MDITRAGSRPSSKGPADWFTGAVRIDPLFSAPAPARAGAARVTFEPGARTALVGDGAVGLCAVLAARELGAERIIAMSRHESRQKLAREFGATDIVTERGDEGWPGSRS